MSWENFEPRNGNRLASNQLKENAVTEARLVDVLSEQNEISLKIAKHQEKAELPKREFVVYDGTDVTEYSSFIRSFMRTVHSKCEDDADKIFYLEQYTAGLAKQFVKSCNSSDATKACKQALKILVEEYGNEHKHRQHIWKN